MKMEAILKSYGEQTRNLFANTLSQLQPKAWGEGLAMSNEAQTFYNTGGLFADCSLEPAVLNATIQPMQTLSNVIPVVFDNSQLLKWAFITAIDDSDDTLPEEACDFGPSTGNMSACFMIATPGRYSTSTKTLEIDEIIKKAHRGITEDLFLVGSVRGVSAIPSRAQLNDFGFTQRAAYRRQMSLAGRKLQRTLGKAFWVGDPTDDSQYTDGGGRVAFRGLDLLIDDDYAAKEGVTGTNCAALNSDVKTFPFCVNDVDEGGRNMFDYLKALEFTLWNRANGMGLLPFTATFVMRSEMWYSLLQTLPCQMMGNGCQGAANSNTSVNVNDGIVEVVRARMADSMQLTINGHTYPVVLDDFIPVTQVAIPGEGEGDPDLGVSYTSSIYFVPLTVAGEQVLEWRLVDYSEITPALSSLPSEFQSIVSGYSDGGRFHWSMALTGNGRCSKFDVKVEPTLVLRAPMLAGKITDVNACLLQDSSVFNPSEISLGAERA